MKQMIQKWLGIKSEQEIRDTCHRIVHGETFIKRISEIVTTDLEWREAVKLRDATRSTAKQTVTEIVGAEKFIDDVVARIKNKQI